MVNGPFNVWVCRRRLGCWSWSMLGIDYPKWQQAAGYLRTWVEERNGKPDGVVLPAGEKPLGPPKKKRKRGQ